MLQARPTLGVCFLSQPYFVSGIRVWHLHSRSRFEVRSAVACPQRLNATQIATHTAGFPLQRPAISSIKFKFNLKIPGLGLSLHLAMALVTLDDPPPQVDAPPPFRVREI